MKDLMVVKQPEVWLHYSDMPDQIVMYDAEQEEGVTDRIYGKPKGLWITPEYAENNWYDWCVSEDFLKAELNFIHELSIKPEAKLLRLESISDIDAFTKEYAFSAMERVRSFMDDLTILSDTKTKEYVSKRRDGVDWPRLAKEYQGILIPTYIWERRLSFKGPPADWYYTWDCASGCIWSADAIEKITLRSEVSAGFVSRPMAKLSIG